MEDKLVTTSNMGQHIPELTNKLSDEINSMNTKFKDSIKQFETDHVCSVGMILNEQDELDLFIIADIDKIR